MPLTPTLDLLTNIVDVYVYRCVVFEYVTKLYYLYFQNCAFAMTGLHNTF